MSYGTVGKVRVWGKKHDLTADVERLLAEARADEARRCAADVCEYCASDEPLNGVGNHAVTKDNRTWEQKPCTAKAIHERLHRESEAKSVDK